MSKVTICAALLAVGTTVFAANVEIANVPPGRKLPILPNPLVTFNGSRVNDASTWREIRRPEILHFFESNVFGKSPQPPADGLPFFYVDSVDEHALGGKAVRKEVTVALAGKVKMSILLFLPVNHRPAPIFLGLNFLGNQAITTDRNVALPLVWSRMPPPKPYVKHVAAPSTRGTDPDWPVEQILAAGYGVATIYHGDIEPDWSGGFALGVRAALLPPGQTDVKSDEWGRIAAWAWGLSRAMDYLEMDADVDAHRVAVIGHSRMGKAAVWAGAMDERFAMVISNESGCGGAAICRGKYGETIARIQQKFPPWFCGNFLNYADREELLPVDNHELIALIAPRPVYVSSAVEDVNSDPFNEFLGAKFAEPVYLLLGTQGFGVDGVPPIAQSVGRTIGYHERWGKHDMTPYDWEQYLRFAEREMRD